MVRQSQKMAMIEKKEDEEKGYNEQQGRGKGGRAGQGWAGWEGQSKGRAEGQSRAGEDLEDKVFGNKSIFKFGVSSMVFSLR
jgi:hypothetical protein